MADSSIKNDLMAQIDKLSPQLQLRLLDLAKNAEVSRIVRRQALFWLANSDNDESVAALAELLTR